MNPAYTSQVHHECGKFRKRNGRSFRCPHCGKEMDADVNATYDIMERKNIKEITLLLSRSTSLQIMRSRKILRNSQLKQKEMNQKRKTAKSRKGKKVQSLMLKNLMFCIIKIKMFVSQEKDKKKSRRNSAFFDFFENEKNLFFTCFSSASQNFKKVKLLAAVILF